MACSCVGGARCEWGKRHEVSDMHHATLNTHTHTRIQPHTINIIVHPHHNITISHLCLYNYYFLMESTHVSIYHAQHSSLMMMVVVAAC